MIYYIYWWLHSDNLTFFAKIQIWNQLCYFQLRYTVKTQFGVEIKFFCVDNVRDNFTKHSPHIFKVKELFMSILISTLHNKIEYIFLDKQQNRVTEQEKSHLFANTRLPIFRGWEGMTYFSHLWSQWMVNGGKEFICFLSSLYKRLVHQNSNDEPI